MYSVECMPEAQKNLACLDKVVAQRVLNKLKWLAANFELVKPEPLTSQWRGLYILTLLNFRLGLDFGVGLSNGYSLNGSD